MEEKITVWELLDDQIRMNFDEIQELDIGSEERRKMIAETTALMEKQIEYERSNNEYYDKQERRRLEEEKMKAENAIEERKLKVDWKKIGAQLGLVTIPLIIKIIAKRFEEIRMYDFEEHGRLTSGVSRQFRFTDPEKKE